MHMEITDYIAIVSIGISIGGGIYAAVTNTKNMNWRSNIKENYLNGMKKQYQ